MRHIKTKIQQSPFFMKQKVLNYFDKMHPVVFVMTSSLSLKCQPAHTHIKVLSQGRRSFHLRERCVLVKHRLPELCSGQGSAFCVCHLQSKCTWTWTRGFLGNQPIEGTTMVIPIIHSAQCSCGISYMVLCLCSCARMRLCLTDLHVCECKDVMWTWQLFYMFVCICCYHNR